MADAQYLTVEHLNRKQIARVFSKIRVDAATSCWLWTGAMHGRGYGVTTYRAKFTLAHRLLYAWLVAPLPLGKGHGVPELDHACRVRKCCNPAHVELVTGKVNVLRGDGLTAMHARKTSCPLGHELKRRKDGAGRYCPRCSSDASLASYYAGRRTTPRRHKGS